MTALDHNSCAVCGSNVGEYVGKAASSKQLICDECSANLKAMGIHATTGKQLLAWMKMQRPRVVLDILTRVGFSTCLFPNSVDAWYNWLCGRSEI